MDRGEASLSVPRLAADQRELLQCHQLEVDEAVPGREAEGILGDRAPGGLVVGLIDYRRVRRQRVGQLDGRGLQPGKDGFQPRSRFTRNAADDPVARGRP